MISASFLPLLLYLSVVAQDIRIDVSITNAACMRSVSDKVKKYGYIYKRSKHFFNTTHSNYIQDCIAISKSQNSDYEKLLLLLDLETRYMEAVSNTLR